MLKFINSIICNIFYYKLQRVYTHILFSLFYFIYLFLERGKGREKEWERNINVWLPLTRPLLGTLPETQACALTGNGTGDPLVHRLALNLLTHTSQVCSLHFWVPFFIIELTILGYISLACTFLIGLASK